MLIIHTKYFPFGDYTTINIFGILFTKCKTLSDRTINHESIHTEQMKELLFIFFYIWYGIEYLIIRLFHKTQDGAYYDVSFEEEAYKYENDLNYINSRKHYEWINYINIKDNN